MMMIIMTDFQQLFFSHNSHELPNLVYLLFVGARKFFAKLSDIY